MSENMSQDEVCTLLAGGHVPKKKSQRHFVGQNCSFPGCVNTRQGVTDYCDSHNAQIARKGVLSPLKSRWWSEEEVEIIKKWYADRVGGKLELAKLSEMLGRTRPLISRKARELGLSDVHRKWRKPHRKWPTDEESKAAIVRGVKKHQKEHGHPRGMSGKKHKPEVLAEIGRKSAERHARLTRDDYRQMGNKASATKIAKYGTAGPPAFRSNPYSRAKGGRRVDLGEMYFRSAWEANYARYLNWLTNNKQIRGWKYEARRFAFDGIKRGCLTYTPDFEVVELDGSVVYHEVKGWMDRKSKTRLKRMAKYYPNVRVVVIGRSQYMAIRKAVGALIPTWE